MIVVKILPIGNEKRRKLCEEKLKHEVLEVEKASEAVSKTSELKREVNAVLFGLSEKEGSKPSETIQAVNELLKKEESKHVKIVILSTLKKYQDLNSFKQEFENLAKRELTSEELKRMIVLQEHSAYEKELENLKKHLGVI